MEHHPAALPFLDRVDVDRIHELRERDQFFWLDLESPTTEDLDLVGSCLGIHPLALEDAANLGQRAKLDEYGDHAALVYYGVADVGGRARRLQLMELHMFVHGDAVVTVHRGPWRELPLLRSTFARVPLGSEALVVYRILDALSDSYFPLVERIDTEIEQIEQAVVLDPQPQQIHDIMRLKRDLSALRRTVGPVRDVAGSAISRLAEIPGFDEGPRDYFRDVYDHMIRTDRSLEAARVLLSDVLSVHAAGVAQRQNSTVERLTLVSSIFLPLSFVAGFFGMNFGWMVRSIDGRAEFLVWGIGGLLLSLALLAPLLLRSRKEQR